MAKDKDQFHPEDVEEQTEQLSSSNLHRSLADADPGTRFLQDLHLVCSTDEGEAEEDARSLQRAWNRIAAATEQQQPDEQRVSTSRKHVRLIVMPKSNPTPNTSDLYGHHT